MKDKWDKALVIAQVSGFLLIPLVIALVGWQVSQSLAERETKADLTKFAINVLQDRDTAAAHRELRAWALEILKVSSPVPISDDLIIHARCCGFPRMVDSGIIVPQSSDYLYTSGQPR